MKDILKEYITRAVFCIIPKKVQELSGCLFVFHIYDGNPCFPESVFGVQFCNSELVLH